MRTWKERFVQTLLGAGMATTLACGGAAIPQSELTEAKSSAKAAEAVGAKDEPQAALHLKMAEDAIVEAEKLIEEGENEKALPLLQRARSDAELSRAITQEAQTREAAEKALTKLGTLEKDVRPQGDRS